jgi:hypothetical protein
MLKKLSKKIIRYMKGIDMKYTNSNSTKKAILSTVKKFYLYQMENNKSLQRMSCQSYFNKQLTFQAF